MAKTKSTKRTNKKEEYSAELDMPVVEEQSEGPVLSNPVLLLNNPVRCPDCPLKAGLKDEHTLCPTCNGLGLVETPVEEEE